MGIPVPIKWLEGLSEYGFFVEMVFKEGKDGKCSKKPRLTLDRYERLSGKRGVEQAIRWLEKGSPIGIVIKAHLWVLDADTPEKRAQIADWLLDHGITPLMVTTKRGAHFYFLLPADFPTEGLKAHINAGDMDFKFGPNTILVAPGTVWKDRSYTPASEWAMPPVVDPREFLEDGDFWKQRDDRPFLVCEKPDAERLYLAKKYAASPKTPVSISGKRGNTTLSYVCEHIVGWYRMHPVVAANILAKGESNWNARCTDKSGKPDPWTFQEILSRCQEGVGKGSEYGRREYIRFQAKQDDLDRLHALVNTLKTCIDPGSKAMTPTSAVLDLFQACGLPDLSAKSLGTCLGSHGIQPVKATGKRIMVIRGLEQAALQNAIHVEPQPIEESQAMSQEPHSPAVLLPGDAKEGLDCPTYLCDMLNALWGESESEKTLSVYQPIESVKTAQSTPEGSISICEPSLGGVEKVLPDSDNAQTIESITLTESPIFEPTNGLESTLSDIPAHRRLDAAKAYLDRLTLDGITLDLSEEGAWFTDAFTEIEHYHVKTLHREIVSLAQSGYPGARMATAEAVAA